MTTSEPVNFRIISRDGNEEQNALFNIDPAGQLTVAGKLDREIRDSYIVTVLAETEDDLPLSTFADITIKILDENDNAPTFESNPYYVEVAENIEEGTSLIRGELTKTKSCNQLISFSPLVIAHDLDQSKNKEIRFSFGTDIGDLANFFTVDQYSGWITTLVPLDMETRSEFKLQVVATDNGNNKHFAMTQVHIKLKDYNDNPPVFSQDHYIAAGN
jgi:protocadherin Fat 1/2/3